MNGRGRTSFAKPAITRMPKGDGATTFSTSAASCASVCRVIGINAELLEVSIPAYMRERLQVFVLEAVAEGSFAPSVPVEDLFSFMAVSINGIIHE